MKLPSNDKNTRQEQGSLPIRAKVCQFTKAPIKYVNDTPTKNHQLYEWQLVGEQGNDLHGFHIHENLALPNEQL